MSRYSPSGIGEYRGRPNYLAEAIRDAVDRFSQRRREREVDTRRVEEIAGGREFDREMATRAEESALARELRQNAAEEARFARGEQLDIAREERVVAREAAERERELSGLASGLRRAIPGLEAVGNADQAVRPGTFEDFQATEALLASGDAGLMRGALVDRALEPGRMARDLGMYRQKALIDREINPPAPRAAPRPDTMMVGGRPYIVGANGVLQPMTLPDGSPPSVVGPGTRTTVAQQKAGTFLTMAEDAAQKLDQYGAPSLRDVVASRTPLIGNAMMTGEGQMRDQAAYQLADAWLRFTSGAAVPETEVERYARTFTPRLGDTEETLRTKSAARQKILEALRGAAGMAAVGEADLIDRLYDEVP